MFPSSPRRPRLRAALATAWVAAVSLACFEEPTDEVPGDRAMSGGGCPSEPCAPYDEASPIVFVSPRPFFAEPSADRLPPVAAGSWTEIGQQGVVDAGYALEADGLEVGERNRDWRWPLHAPETGFFTVRLVDGAGDLVDQTSIRAERVTRGRIRPVYAGLVRLDAVGPEAGWKLFAGAQHTLVKELFSPLGNRLVAMEDVEVEGAAADSLRQGGVWDVFSFEAPAEGSVSVTLRAGALTRVTDFVVVTYVDDVILEPLADCSPDYGGDDVCFVALHEDDPVSGAPLRYREPGYETDYFLSGRPCLPRRQEPYEVEVTTGTTTRSFEIPARDPSCY